MRRSARGAAVAGVALGSVSLAVGVMGTAAGDDGQTVAAATVQHLLVDGSPVHDAMEPFEGDAARAIDFGAAATSTTPPKARVRHRPPVAAKRQTRRPQPSRPATKRASRSTQRQPLTPRDIARQMVSARGWSEQQFSCLDKLWTRESNWKIHETNASSGAYGIPQSLPASKMARFGDDWRDNPVTQIRWGLWYIAGRYGTPCGAWAHSQQYNFY